MPKKTKREKVLAEYRRKLKELKQADSRVETHENIKKEEKALPTKLKLKPKDVVSSIDKKEDEASIRYFYQDLKKSLFLIAIIVSLEVLLYFVRI